MGRIPTFLAALLVLLVPVLAQAEPADIDAAARGVVRVIIIGEDGEELVPISHGTGFAVASDQVVTNAHVLRDALRDDALRIGIIPSGGGEAVSPREHFLPDDSEALCWQFVKNAVGSIAVEYVEQDDVYRLHVRDCVC